MIMLVLLLLFHVSSRTKIYGCDKVANLWAATLIATSRLRRDRAAMVQILSVATTLRNVATTLQKEDKVATT